MDPETVANVMDTSFTKIGQELPPPIPPKPSRRRQSSSSPEIHLTPNKRKRITSYFKAPLQAGTEGTPLASETPTTLGPVVPPANTPGQIPRSTSIRSVSATATGGPATGGAPVFIDSDSDHETESTSIKERAARGTQTNATLRLSSFAPPTVRVGPYRKYMTTRTHL